MKVRFDLHDGTPVAKGNGNAKLRKTLDLHDDTTDFQDGSSAENGILQSLHDALKK